MRTGGDELELATSQPTATVAATDGTHVFRIRRNHAMTNAIAAVTITSTANHGTEKRSVRSGAAPCSPGGIGPVPTTNGAPYECPKLRKLTERSSAATRSASKTGTQIRIGSAKSRNQRTISANGALVRVDLPVHRQDMDPGLSRLQIHLVSVEIREHERIDQVRARPRAVLTEAVAEDRRGTAAGHAHVEARCAAGVVHHVRDPHVRADDHDVLRHDPRAVRGVDLQHVASAVRLVAEVDVGVRVVVVPDARVGAVRDAERARADASQEPADRRLMYARREEVPAGDVDRAAAADLTRRVAECLRRREQVVRCDLPVAARSVERVALT